MARSKQAGRIAQYRFAPKTYEVYTPEKARYAAEAEGANIRQQYQSLRRVAEDRLRKLRKAGLEQTSIYTENVNRFPRLTEIGTDNRMLYDAIAEVTHFLAAKKSTVYGYREQEAAALETFTGHYSAEGLTGLSWKAFGSLMKSIKGTAQTSAYYRRWKTAYRAAISRAQALGLTVEELNEKVSRGLIKIGAAGGLLDARGKTIRRGWAGLGK